MKYEQKYLYLVTVPGEGKFKFTAVTKWAAIELAYREYMSVQPNRSGYTARRQQM